MTPDGLAFLAVAAASTQSISAETQEMHIVVNWFEELKRLVPVR
jgi:hypothetical protein